MDIITMSEHIQESSRKNSTLSSRVLLPNERPQDIFDLKKENLIEFRDELKVFFKEGKQTPTYNDVFSFDYLENEWKPATPALSKSALENIWLKSHSLTDFGGLMLYFNYGQVTINPREQKIKFSFLRNRIHPQCHSGLYLSTGNDWLKREETIYVRTRL
jgi:hypothetical protein